ncbi:MAG: hypothetical protein ACM32O_02480 [Clostridia bacterium]
MIIRSFLILCLLLLQPLTAFAYSYGDPNKEEIAETYKEIAAHLEKSPVDWAGALSAYDSRKAEIALEFGKATADTIQTNFDNKQKDLVLHNYRAVLVKNVERRLKSAEKEFADYAKAKLMLAKGRGTFAVLDSAVGDAASKKVYDAFDKALTALGNPGLFGVGVVPANKQEFQAQTNVIISTIKPLFAIKAAAPAQPKPAAAKPASATQPAKPAENKPAQPQATKPAVQQPAKANPEQPATQPASAVPAAQQAIAVPAPNTQSATQPQQTTGAAQPTSSETAATADSSQEASAQPDAASASAEQPSSAPGESKVNPLVTVSVIGAILLIAGGAFWFGKRKGLL